MKKRIYLLLLSVIVIFFSCRDESGDFVEQLFTDQQITNALRDCIEIASDSTLNTLCIVDTLKEEYGYSYYDSKNYRITLPAGAQQVVDTLSEYGFGETIDTLIMNMNRAAELCGNKIKSQFLDPIRKNITFPKPNATLHGGNNAITDYVKETKQNEFISLLTTSVLFEQFNTLEITTTWDSLQVAYYKITDHYFYKDILTSTAQQMTDGFFMKMASVEEAVRKNPDLRGKPDSWLYKVFATLKD
ncbi:MAG: DUF4197 domain-containing protein [Lentimicrobiaceae bacterium]|nr:DUF4197 domain-containing protein [Lentimicrobiaceae bacterium]